ncbi:MAG: hypothetical protein K8R99_08605 [Actinomycetia bacterium]|nr:hypothetical protein [Actinomycetes bacterium]
MTDASQTGIRITARFFPLMWILFFIKPRVGVDGSDMQTAWKTPTFIPTTPGQHTVTCYFPYFFPKKAGAGEIAVNVAQGQVVDVTYKAPWIVFLKGRMSVA